MLQSSVEHYPSNTEMTSLLKPGASSTWHNEGMNCFDIIGDVHGQGEKLKGLLKRLGYSKSSGAYRHAYRQAIFVGDLIDRGKEQPTVLSIVRNMQEAGAAQVIMGNHEFNAIAYATEDYRHPGHYLREHSAKNNKQHKWFLEEFTSKEQAVLIDWFKSLPLWLDLDEGIRVVHACWHESSKHLVEQSLVAGQLTDDILVEAATTGTDLYNAVEVLLKGPELSLEQYGLPTFLDKGGDPRKRARIRWWNGDGRSLSDLAEIPPDATDEQGVNYPQFEDAPCTESDLAYAYRDTKPVFFGHYWRQWPPKKVFDWTDTTASVDFSAAKGGPLVAYRWDGESTLTDANYMEYPGNTNLTTR